MQLKTINLKFTTKAVFGLAISLLGYSSINAQEIIQDKVKDKNVETPNTDERKKIDGVAAVVGDFVVLDSDIDKEFIQLQARGVSIEEITRCQLFGKLLEDKLYTHHAIQDSITVNELEIRNRIDQQIDQFLEEAGSMDELLKIYNMDSEQTLRDEMFEINKNGQLALEMQKSIVEDVEVTPEEVREYFNSIP